MSKLDELIKKYCPDGVEYKALDEVIISLNTGLNPRKFFKLNTNDAKNYYITIREIHNNKIQITDSTDKINDDALRLCNNRSNLDKGDILFSGTGTIGEIALIEDKPYNWNIKEGVYAIKPIQKMIISKYLMYILQTDTIRTAYMKKVAGGTVKSIPMKDLKKITIPVPPLPVQEEIVRILDSFTSLTAELQDKLNTEFQARKKQYEYYASNLFDKASIEWKSMGDIASFVYGYTDKAQDTGDTRFIRITDIDEQGHLKNEEPKYITINNEAKKSLLSYGDLIMARTGATYGKTLYFESEFPSVYASFLIKIIPNKNIILNKYYWHFTRTSFYWEQANRLVTTGGQPQFNTPAIKQIKIPVPSIDVQKQIINILDKFDSLINDLTTGLPAEIAARQKQYKYYRDKLLTFKELS